MDEPRNDEEALPERPDRIRLDDPLAPRSPWSFGREAARDGFRFWGLQLIAGWLALHLATSAAWALHLRSHAGFGLLQSGGSGLPTHWGELLTARDVWELAENGGLKHDVLGTATPVLAALGLLWVLWAGWRLQAETAALPGRFRPWIYGLFDALLIGVLPLALAAWPVLWAIGRMAGLGFATFGWVNLVGGAVLRLAVVSAVMLQWWFCRLERAAAPQQGFRLGSWGAYGAHLRRAFLRLWLHPIHWGTMVVGGSALRLGLSWFALWIGWRLGGGSPGRVLLFLLGQLVAVAAGAWLLGWFLRVAALFWVQDRRVVQARGELRAAASGAPAPEPNSGGEHEPALGR